MTDAEKIARRYYELRGLKSILKTNTSVEAASHLAWFTALMEHWEEKRLPEELRDPNKVMANGRMLNQLLQERNDARKELEKLKALLAHERTLYMNGAVAGGVRGAAEHGTSVDFLKPVQPRSRPSPSPPTLKRAESAASGLVLEVGSLEPWVFISDEMAREVYHYCTQAYLNGREDGRTEK